MGVTTEKITQASAVRVDAVEVHTVVPGLAGIIPAAEHNGAIIRHHGVEVVALVEGDLFNVLTIVVHHMQNKPGAITLLVQTGILGFAFIKQHRLGNPLTG